MAVSYVKRIKVCLIDWCRPFSLCVKDTRHVYWNNFVMVVIVIVQDCLKEETKSDKMLPVYGLEGIFPIIIPLFIYRNFSNK